MAAQQDPGNFKCGHARRFGSSRSLAGSGPRLIAYRRVPSPPPGTTPAPMELKTPSRRRHWGWWWLVGLLAGHVAWAAAELTKDHMDPNCKLAVVNLAFRRRRWSLSLQPPLLLLSPSRPSRTRVRVGPPATGSSPTRPAPTQSRIRVERATTRSATGRGLAAPPRPPRRRGGSSRPT